MQPSEKVGTRLKGKKMNIVFVCTGNTCRSPMAEGYLKSLNLKDVFAASAGLSVGGEKVSENSAKVMSEAGIDIFSHLSTPLTKELAEKADKIYVMTSSHYHIVCEALKNADISTEKVSLLSNTDIPDPFMQDIAVYRKCRDQIFDAIDKIFNIEHIDVVPLSISDAKDIENLEKECFSSPWSINSIESALNGNNIFFGIKEDNELCGYISMYHSLGEGYINNLAVSEKHRRKKFGFYLLKELINFCADADFEFLTLEVRESNTPAINLYKKFGFNEEGRRKNYYTAPKEDAIILTRRF